MSGRITHAEEQLRPDPRYGDKVLSRFINCIMQDGKKSVAQRVVYDAFEQIEKRLEKENNPDAPKAVIDLFHMAIDNVKPSVEVRSKRVGGANYQVPMQVTQRRRQSRQGGRVELEDLQGAAIAAAAWRFRLRRCRGEAGRQVMSPRRGAHPRRGCKVSG